MTLCEGAHKQLQTFLNVHSVARNIIVN